MFSSATQINWYWHLLSSAHNARNRQKLGSSFAQTYSIYNVVSFSKLSTPVLIAYLAIDNSFEALRSATFDKPEDAPLFELSNHKVTKIKSIIWNAIPKEIGCRGHSHFHSGFRLCLASCCRDSLWMGKAVRVQISTRT